MNHTAIDDIFFAYVESEKAVFPTHASLAQLGVDHLIERCKAFKCYLAHQPLTPAQRRELLEAYEAYVLVELAYLNTADGNG